MNEGLNDFLTRMGIEETASESNETVTAVAEPVDTEPEVIDAVDIPPDTPEHQSLSEEDLDDILSELGFEDSSEESEEDVEEGEDTTEGPLYVGDGIMAQISDSMQPMRLTVTDAGVIGPDGTLVMSREMMDEMADQLDGNNQWTTATSVRDLDAEEDEDWDTMIDSGAIRPVSAVAQVSVHRSDGTVTVESIVNEAADTTEETPAEASIPENSPTLLIDDTTSRFSGAEWYTEVQSHSIILGGAGGIGSWLALQLARMRPHALYIYDDDTVEEANMSGQLYRMQDSGQRKVTALKNIINMFTTTYCIYSNPTRFTSITSGGDVMMCGFDNMEARKTFFNVWRRHVMDLDPEDRKNCLYLDGRLSISVLQVFCITGDDEFNMQRYEEDYLFDDSEAEATVCSMKQTTYMACMIGSFMVNLYTNWCANNLDPVIPYDLPFFTEYDAQNMLFKTIV